MAVCTMETNRPDTRSAGFTLIEVLVALMILAIALMAVIKASNASVRDSIHVRDRLVAHWVAENILSECQLGLQRFSPSAPALSGDTVMMNLSWHWQAVPIGVGKNDERIRVAVYLPGTTRRVEQLEGFVPLVAGEGRSDAD